MRLHLTQNCSLLCQKIMELKKKHLTFINVQSFSCHSILQLFKEDLLLYNSGHVKSGEIKNWVEIIVCGKYFMLS